MLGVGDGRERVCAGRGGVLQVRGQPAEGTELPQKAPLWGQVWGSWGEGWRAHNRSFEDPDCLYFPVCNLFIME